MIYLNALTLLLLFSKCFGADNNDDNFNLRDLHDQPIYSPNNSPEWFNPPEINYHNYEFDNFNLWEHNQQIPHQHPPQQIPQQMYNEDYHPQPSTHQQPIYHQPPHNPYTHYPTIPSQGESSSMPNLQNNPNEIENVNQKYLLVTQEMINQRKEEKGKYKVIKYKPQELSNMGKLIGNIQLDSEVQLNNSEIDQGFSLNSKMITGSVKREKNICVTPGITNIKELSYCIYIEYTSGHLTRKTDFVGTQEIGALNDCKIQQFTTDENIENIQFIVVWSENIFFGKDDVLYASRFNVKNEDFVPHGTITLDINTVEKTKLKYAKRKGLIPDI
uniref:Uncharacterized protein n=1 Tax=Meloidogyne enterolobii TaxID=390850 RepID=A0A6V7X4Q4_MELEN|nr:unnamed protein product [Meloidogyne enterolobii]